MGIYPGIELTYHSLKNNGKLFNFSEINQPKPRQLKNNIIFHKINKIIQE
jgi:hypothetical protein